MAIYLIWTLQAFLILAPLESHSTHPEVSLEEEITISEGILENSDMPFETHRGPGRFDTTLSMNIKYGPILSVRKQLNYILDTDLDFFDGWAPEGEAHVTTVTPVEYFDILKEHISIDEIDQIALEYKIQQSDIYILAIGSATLEIEGAMESTYFILVHSQNLLRIRHAIHRRFIQNGGDPNDWDPDHFFPHITIGYTKRDLHESDGVRKDLWNSWDSRFNLKWVD